MDNEEEIKLDNGSTACKVLIIIGAAGGVLTIFAMVYIALAELANAWPVL